MKLEAKDLRIGNYVIIEPSNEAQQVVDVMCDCVNTKSVEGAHYGIIEPISLTVEWLEKLGFKKLGSSYSILVNSSFNLCLIRFLFENGLNYFSVSVENINNIYLGTAITYVHQLQNLYHALTGEELTIKK